jgi:P4 family phage/plasmid primase-like protien
MNASTTPLDFATDYIRRGCNPVPIPHRSKAPIGNDWQGRRIDAASVSTYFNGAAMNVGVQLGAASAGLTDVDLDCPEALALADLLLPRTKAIFGRPSKPRSHRIYVTTLAETIDKAAIRYSDPTTKETLVELRIGGGGRAAQTVFPGSTHTSGEPIEWAESGDWAKVDGAALRHGVEALAAACLLVRAWPGEGGRHAAALVVGGVLGRAGWSAAKAQQFIGAVAQAAGDAEIADRQAAAESAVKGLAESVNVYGLPALVEFFGEKAAAKIAEWVGFKSGGPAERIGASARAGAGEEAEAFLEDAVDLENGGVTQESVALVFAERFKGRLRCDHDAGAWFEFDGFHWRRDRRRRAFNFVRELGRELSSDKKDGVKKDVRRVTFAAAVETYARAMPHLATGAEEWDLDPFLLGTPGGTLDLRTGELRPASPGEGITKLTAVAPAETAECPRWLQFLDETFSADPEVIGFVKRWAGYCLTGDIREHALVFGSGSGGNGKGVLVRILSGIMSDYAVTAAMETFAASKFDRHLTELASLRGARLVTASETEKGRAWAEARIKQLTGGDPITARFMRQDEFTFPPTMKLFITGNHAPTLQTVDDAIRRRFNILSFNNKPAVADQRLEEKLKGEWPAILRWMLEGCLAWQREGLRPPACVQAATEEYFDSQDLFGDWLAAECEVEPGNVYKSATSKALFESWSAFAIAANVDAGTQTSLADELKTRNLVLNKNVPVHGRPGKYARGFVGIRLIPPPQTFQDRDYG